MNSEELQRLFDLPTQPGRYCNQQGLDQSEAERIAPLWDVLTWDGEPLWSPDTVREQLEDES